MLENRPRKCNIYDLYLSKIELTDKNFREWTVWPYTPLRMVTQHSIWFSREFCEIISKNFQALGSIFIYKQKYNPFIFIILAFNQRIFKFDFRTSHRRYVANEKTENAPRQTPTTNSSSIARNGFFTSKRRLFFPARRDRLTARIWGLKNLEIFV